MTPALRIEDISAQEFDDIHMNRQRFIAVAPNTAVLQGQLVLICKRGNPNAVFRRPVTHISEPDTLVQRRLLSLRTLTKLEKEMLASAPATPFSTVKGD